MEEQLQNLTTEASTSVTHYDYEIEDTGAYLFKTSKDITYRVWFRIIPHFDNFPDISDCVHEFIFDESDNNKYKYDSSKTKSTICHILSSYFEKNKENFIFFICDFSDDRHNCRNRLFNIWFNSYYSNSDYIKFDSQSEIEDSIYLYSIILLKNNPMKNRIEDVFNNLHEQYKKNVE